MLVALKEGKTASRLGRQGALSEERSSTHWHCGCSESGRREACRGAVPCALPSPFPLSAFCFPELVRSKGDDAAADMTCEDYEDEDGLNDVDDGVTVVTRQHIVMERALVWRQTVLDSNPRYFICHLLRSAHGLTFLCLCFLAAKWWQWCLSHRAAGEPNGTTYLKVASMGPGPQ